MKSDKWNLHRHCWKVIVTRWNANSRWLLYFENPQAVTYESETSPFAWCKPKCALFARCCSVCFVYFSGYIITLTCLTVFWNIPAKLDLPLLWIADNHITTETRVALIHLSFTGSSLFASALKVQCEGTILTLYYLSTLSTWIVFVFSVLCW